MLQKFTANIVIEKGFKISQIQNWINEKIKNSKITEMKLYNTELIFDGSLNTFLGDIEMSSMSCVSKAELNQLFESHPWFIHQFSLQEYKMETGVCCITEEVNQYAVSRG